MTKLLAGDARQGVESSTWHSCPVETEAAQSKAAWTTNAKSDGLKGSDMTGSHKRNDASRKAAHTEGNQSTVPLRCPTGCGMAYLTAHPLGWMDHVTVYAGQETPT